MLYITTKFEGEYLLIKIPQNMIEMFSQLTELNSNNMPLEIVSLVMARRLFEHLADAVKHISLQDVSSTIADNNDNLKIVNFLQLRCNDLVYGNPIEILSQSQKNFTEF